MAYPSKVSSKLYINLKKGDKFQIDRFTSDGRYISTDVVIFEAIEECPPKETKIEYGRYTQKYKRYIVHGDFPAWVKQPFIVTAQQRVEIVR